MTIHPEAAVNYLRDLGPLLLEMAGQAKTDAGEGNDFALGQLFDLSPDVSLMQQQASAFQIDLASIGLDGVDTERDLI